MANPGPSATQIFDLPEELLQDIINRSALTNAAGLLLTCKVLSRRVQPHRCKLVLIHSGSPAEQTGFVPVCRALESTRMRDADVTGNGIPATAFAAWKDIACLQLCRMRSPACMASLSVGTLRALALRQLTFDAASEATLRAALLAAHALECLLLMDCSFLAPVVDSASGLSEHRPGAPLLDTLAKCIALWRLEVQGAGSGLISYAGLPRLQHCYIQSDLPLFDHGFPALQLGPALTSLSITLVEGICDAYTDELERLAQLLSNNACLQELELWMYSHWDFDRGEALFTALASMTGLTRFQTLDFGAYALHGRRWAAPLTDLIMTYCHSYEDRLLVLPDLAACQLTSLTLIVEGGMYDDEEFELGQFKSIGDCVSLKALALAVHWDSVRVAGVLCDDVLPRLRGLTRLVLAVGKGLDKHMARISSAAACGVTLLPNVSCGDFYPMKIGVVPAKYRS